MMPQDPVPWLNYSPSAWSVQPLRAAGVFFGGGTPDTSDASYWDGDLPWVSSQDVRGGGLTSTARRITGAGLKNSSARIATAGSLVFVMRSGILKHSLPVSLLEMDSAINQDIKALHPVRLWDARYLLYFFAGWQTQLLAAWRTQGATVESLRFDLMQKTLLPCPPWDAQEAIVAYLDPEVSRIDSLIERKQRFIDLLLEKRAALITHAVTKGLDPNAELKDSGVDWIGAIPSHWFVRRTKQVARLESGHTPSRQHPEWWVDCTVPWITTSEVWQVRDGRAEYITETVEKVSELGLANSSARKLPAGTVVLSRTASVGFSAIMPTEMATSQDFADWVPGAEVLSEYLLYTFRSMRTEFDRLMMGSTHKTIYMPDIQNFVMPLPPLDEQRAIVDSIRSRVRTIDALVDRTRTSIDLLKEYRAALISAAVTGQIEIGN